MARLPYVDPAAASDPVRTALEAVPPLNVFRMVAHAETAFRPWLRFGGALLGEAQLDAPRGEVVVEDVDATRAARAVGLVLLGPRIQPPDDHPRTGEVADDLALDLRGRHDAGLHDVVARRVAAVEDRVEQRIAGGEAI